MAIVSFGCSSCQARLSVPGRRRETGTFTTFTIRSRPISNGAVAPIGGLKVVSTRLRFHKSSESGGNGGFASRMTIALSSMKMLRTSRHPAISDQFLPALFCSPTMELGVDISALNAVYLRNVSAPLPITLSAQGAQGRSGQAAVIVTYCAAQSPHDQYFFERRNDMVAGVVRPPALDITNEELVRSHLHAVWLAEAEAGALARHPRNSRSETGEVSAEAGCSSTRSPGEASRQSRACSYEESPGRDPRINGRQDTCLVSVISMTSSLRSRRARRRSLIEHLIAGANSTIRLGTS